MLTKEQKILVRHFRAALELNETNQVEFAEKVARMKVGRLGDILKGRRNGGALLLRIRDYTLAAYKRHKLKPPAELLGPEGEE